MEEFYSQAAAHFQISNTRGKFIFPDKVGVARDCSRQCSPLQLAGYSLTMLFSLSGNNMYVFPGIGLGTILSEASQITQTMIYASGISLSNALTTKEINQGLLYPDLARIRDVSVQVASGVIQAALEIPKLVRNESFNLAVPDELERAIRQRMYDPHTVGKRIELDFSHLERQTPGDQKQRVPLQKKIWTNGKLENGIIKNKKPSNL